MEISQANIMHNWSSQTKRDIVAWMLTTLLYLPLFYYLITEHETPFLHTPKQELTLTLETFEQRAEEPPEAVEPAVKEEPIEKPIAEEPIIKEAIVEETPVKETPTVEAPIKEIPIKKDIVKPVVEKPVVQKVSKKKKIEKKQTKSPSTNSNGKKNRKKSHSSSANNSNQALAKLKAKINQNKSYPPIARKRGMEGSVSVRFIITASGGVSGISSTGTRVFTSSAESTVRKAFPISTEGLSLPMSASIELVYRLSQ